MVLYIFGFCGVRVEKGWFFKVNGEVIFEVGVIEVGWLIEVI